MIDIRFEIAASSKMYKQVEGNKIDKPLFFSSNNQNSPKKIRSHI